MEMAPDINDSTPAEEFSQSPIAVKNQPTQLPDLIAMSSNEIELQGLAIEAKVRFETYQSTAKTAILAAVALGETLKKAQALTVRFEKWVAENTSIKLSQAYNLIKISSDPELINLAVQSNGLLLPTHLLALCSAAPEVKAIVQEKVEAGKKVPVSEIKRLETENKKLLDSKNALEKDRNNWREISSKRWDEREELQEELDGLKKSIDTTVEEKLKEKKAEIEEMAISQAAADYQATIDSLKETLSNQRAQLAAESKPERIKELNEQIAAKQSELRQLNKQFPDAERNANLRDALNNLMTDIAMLKMKLAMNTGIRLEIATLETLKTARHDLIEVTTMIAELCQQDETVDFEFND